LKQLLLITLCLPLLLTACGKSDDAPANSGGQVASANAISTPPPGTYFPPIEENYGYYRVSYSFFENGCYTGKHKISGYDREITRQRLCDTLQEDWTNRGCARNLRRAYFSNVCPGIAWNPR